MWLRKESWLLCDSEVKALKGLDGWLALKTAVKSDGHERALEIQENSNHCASGLGFFTSKGMKTPLLKMLHARETVWSVNQ